MARYEPFGDLLDDRPRLVIRENLRNCKTVIELAEEAKAKGFEVEVAPGSFIHDIRIKESKDAPVFSLTVRGAQAYLRRY
jgi:hypothetical protein